MRSTIRRRGLLLALVGLLIAAGPAAAASGTAGGAAGGGPAPPEPTVLVLGIPDLRWTDLSAAATPALWKLAAAGGTANLVVRGRREITTPLDGWATLGAGNRAGATQLFSRSGPDTGWRQLDATALTGSDVGALASALRGAGDCVSAPAVQPPSGPALIGARPPLPGRPCQVRLADSEALVRPGTESRAARLSQVDAWVARQRSTTDRRTVIVVAGLSDGVAGPAHLHVLTMSGPGVRAGAALTSATTGLTGYVQLVDLAPTILRRLDVAVPGSMIGAAATQAGPRRSLHVSWTAYRDDDVHAVLAHRLLIPALLAWLGIALLCAGVSVALFRLGRPRAGRGWARGSSLVLLAAPPASLLAGLVPWWRAGGAGLLLATLVAAAAVLIFVAAAAWLPVRARRDERRRPVRWLRSVRVLLGCSAAVVTFDLVTGSRLQLSSITGYNPLVAGRFTGIGNPGFGLFAAYVLLGLALSHRRTRAVAAVGALAVVVDGAPALGADIGGVLALVPALLVLLVRRSGRRLTARVLALGAAAAVALLGALALVDSARGTRQGHLGRFAGELVRGEAKLTLHRKLVADLDLLFGNPAGPVFLVAFAAAVLVLRAALLPARAETGSSVVGWLRHTLAGTDGLADGLVATMWAAGIGLLVNDSGIALAAAALLVVVPVTVIAGCDPDVVQGRRPGPPTTRHARTDTAIGPPVHRVGSSGVF